MEQLSSQLVERPQRTRRLILNIHRYAGVVLGAFLCFLGGTGTIIAFRSRSDCWLHPKLCSATPQSSRILLDDLYEALADSRPGYRLRTMILPERLGQPAIFDFMSEQPGGSPLQVYVDPYSGKVLGDLQGAGIIGWLEEIHSRFLLPEEVGEIITGSLSLVLVGLAATGAILWWRYKRFSIKWANASWRRRWFDIHLATGMASFVVLTFLGLTGAMLAFHDEINPWLFQRFPAPSSVEEPSPVLVLPSFAGPVTRDQAVELARKALPGAQPHAIYGGGITPIIVSMRFPEDDSKEGRSHVWINAMTGEVTQIKSSRRTTAADRILTLNYALHTGELFGMPMRILLSLSTVFLVLQVISGYYMWWRREKR